MRWVGKKIHFQRWKGSLEKIQFHSQKKLIAEWYQRFWLY